MATRTEEISSAVKTGGGGVAEAIAHAERLAESTRDKVETAAEHGWGGVAGNMEQAVEALEGVIEQLATAEKAYETASAVLDEITEQMSSPEVVQHLETALGELDTAKASLEDSVARVDEAIMACEAAGQTSLPGLLQNLREEITEAHEMATQSRADADAERQHAETWGDEVDEEEKS